MPGIIKPTVKFKVSPRGPQGLAGGVQGPASSVAGNFPSFSDTSGENLGDSGIGESDITTLQSDVDDLQDGTHLHSLTSKTTPADNDEIGLVDSAASYVLKKLSFLNLKIAVLKAVYPVGSVYVNATDATSPATLLGFGTWTAFGAGRVMVGQDTGDTDFDTLEETRGAKTHTLTSAEMPTHLHTVDPPATNTGNQSQSHTHSDSSAIRNIAGSDVSLASGAVGLDVGITTGNKSQSHTHSVNIGEFDSGSAGSGDAHNNIQPSIVVKMWKRTA